MYLAKESVCLHIHIHCMVHVNKILFHQMNLTCIHTLKCTHTTHTHTHTHMCTNFLFDWNGTHSNVHAFPHTGAQAYIHTHTQTHATTKMLFFIDHGCMCVHTHTHACMPNQCSLTIDIVGASLSHKMRAEIPELSCLYLGILNWLPESLCLICRLLKLWTTVHPVC